MPMQFDPNTMQAVDDSVLQTHSAEELELAIVYANQNNQQVNAPMAEAPIAPAAEPPLQAAPAPELIREPVPVWTPDDWKRESEAFRNKKFGTQEAAPQAPAPASDLQSLHSRLDKMAELFQSRNQQTAQPAPPSFQGYRAELDPELAQADPALAQRLESLSRNFETMLAQERQTHAEKLAAIEAREAARDAALNQDRTAAYQQKWETALTQLVPDLSEYLPGTPGGIALAQWANRIPEYAGAVNPATCYQASPHFLASIITQFRPIFKGTASAPRVPSIADIANPVLNGSAPAVIQQPVPEGPMLTPQQMATAWDDVQKLMGQGLDKKADALIQAYERTAQAMTRPS